MYLPNILVVYTLMKNIFYLESIKSDDMITPLCIIFNYCFECLKYRFIIFNFHTNFTGMSI